METLNVTATRDQEQFYRIINNLISTNKEFQIMITVPSGETKQVAAGAAAPAAAESVVRDLEKDVTDMIHEIAGSYQGVSISAGSHHDVGEGCGDAGFDYQNPLSYDCQEVSDHAKPCGTRHSSCHRGGVVQRQDGDARRTFWLYDQYGEGEADQFRVYRPDCG